MFIDKMDVNESTTLFQTFSARTTLFSAVLNTALITTESHETLSLQYGMQHMLQVLSSTRKKNGVVYVIGNGGSAAIASHATIDFLNMAKMKATAMLDPAITTCISNDYGYDQVYSKQLDAFIQPQDVLIAISSSGNSKNIINAVNIAQKRNAKVITLSGFLAENPLRQVGHYNLWLDSKDYGQVEIGHAFVLHYLTDCLREIKIEESA